MRRILKKIKTDSLDDHDTEYIDIDTLLAMYLEEYKNTKRNIQKKLQKQFTRYI